MVFDWGDFDEQAFYEYKDNIPEYMSQAQDNGVTLVGVITADSLTINIEFLAYDDGTAELDLKYFVPSGDIEPGVPMLDYVGTSTLADICSQMSFPDFVALCEETVMGYVDNNDLHEITDAGFT